MTAASTIVNFGVKADQPKAQPSGTISIEIQSDEDLVFNKPIPFDIFVSPEELSYDTISSDGTIMYLGFVTSEAVEEATLALDATTSIKNVAIGTVKITWTWPGSLPAFSVAEKEITFVAPVLGKVEITYNYESHRHTITVPKPYGYDDEKDPGHEVIIVAFADENTKGSTTLTVKNVQLEEVDEEAEAEAADETISIEVDPDFKDDILPGTLVPLLVKSSLEEYSVAAAYGSVSRTAPGSVRNIEATLSFSLTKEATLPEIPAGGLEWEWTSLSATEAPTPLFADDKVTLSVDFIGDLLCRYKTVGDIWTLTAPPPDLAEGEVETFEGYSVKVVAKAGENTSDVTVDYAWQDEISIEIDPTWLKEKDGEQIFPNEKVPLLIRSSDPEYRIETMYGTLTEKGAGSSSPEDMIKFALRDTATLPTDPTGDSFSAEWDGVYNETPSTPEVEGGVITLEEETVGRLKVGYTVVGGSWELDAPWPAGHPDEIMDIEVAVALRNARGSVTVTFDASVDKIDDETLPGEIKIFLNADLNDGKSSFVAGDIPILVVMASFRDKPYTVTPSMGEVKKKDEGFEFEQEDTISFSETDSGELSYLPSEIVSWEWIATENEKIPLFALKAVTIPEPTIGTLKVTYTTTVDLWELTPPPVTTGSDRLESAPSDEGYEEEFDIIVVATQDIAKAEASVSFGPDEEEEEEEVGDKDWDYKVEVVEYGESATSVPLANVNFLGNDYVTDENGEFFVGKIPSGNYDVLTTAEGFIPSDEDRLRNDTVKIGE